MGRTRLLVRLGPALGLMGTLIPLAPALDGLARGDVDTLTENLRLAFSITVLGILIGVVALALSLFRERLYGQDFSDLEYVAAILTDDGSAAASIAPSAPAKAVNDAPASTAAPTVTAPVPVPPSVSSVSSAPPAPPVPSPTADKQS
ncbi:MotA/TolQ/ExbB proton channel family protein [Aeromicrobium sp. UC242_57]|uniref:MotA/TolQ/ExbB proton channel family protein n=1 Tax=Aeromicrobium sp. UC242_57 TaxID=3374624 RepID=UPI00379EC816